MQRIRRGWLLSERPRSERALSEQPRSEGTLQSRRGRPLQLPLKRVGTPQPRRGRPLQLLLKRPLTWRAKGSSARLRTTRLLRSRWHEPQQWRNGALTRNC